MKRQKGGRGGKGEKLSEKLQVGSEDFNLCPYSGDFDKKQQQRNHLHEHERMKTATSDEIIIIKRSDVGAGEKKKPRMSHRRETPLHTRD